MQLMNKLSILMMFNMLKSLGSIEESKYEELCNSLFQLINRVLVKPASLHGEQQEIINEFKDFIFSMFEKYNTKSKQETKKALHLSLLSLSIANGNASLILDCISKLLEQESTETIPIEIELIEHLQNIDSFISNLGIPLYFLESKKFRIFFFNLLLFFFSFKK